MLVFKLSFPLWGKQYFKYPKKLWGTILNDKKVGYSELEKGEKFVFCYQNCSSDGEKLLKFEAEGPEFAKCLRSLEQFIQT